jgi:hypothetical protein
LRTILEKFTYYYIMMDRTLDFPVLLKRPLSAITAIFAVLLIVYEVIQIANGRLYQNALDKMDGTTLVELGILTLLGIYT